jgi:hypothetical protein
MKAYISTITLCLVSVFTVNAHAEPAIIFNEDLCTVVLLPPGEEPIPLIGDKLQAVVANSSTPFLPGKFTCQGHHSEPLEFAIVQRAPCFIPGTSFGDLFTENGKTVFTPGGNWTAQCMFKIPEAD